MNNPEDVMCGLAKYSFLEKALGPYVKWALTTAQGNEPTPKIVQAINISGLPSAGQARGSIDSGTMELNLSAEEFIKAFGFHAA